MEVKLPNGKYVLAVSGGVDSMVLLDLLAKEPSIELIVAHFNHGIRPEAGLDEVFVAKKAENYGVKFVSGHGQLGKDASEALAREARYKFLRKAREKHSAKAIITAHHQDDLIETALLNTLRGTNFRGLISIKNNSEIRRPLLGYSKREILNYAQANNLKWREDSSNQDSKYLRNRLREKVKGLEIRDRQNLISNIDKVAKRSGLLNAEIAKLSHLIYKKSEVDRYAFTSLPVEIGNQLIAYWLRELQVADFDRQIINRLNTQIRTSRAGSSHPVKDDLTIKLTARTAQFITPVG